MAPRSTRFLMDTIEYGMWLVFDEQGNVRMTRTDPGLGRGERKMFLTAELPKAIFRTAELRGTIKVASPERDAFRIDVEAASAALKGALGVDIDLRVETPDV